MISCPICQDSEIKRLFTGCSIQSGTSKPADNVPIKKDARDKYESNWDLSTHRAIEVVKYLTGKGMDPKSVTAAGYGEYKPVANNSTDIGKSKNRRVELFLIPKIIKRIENN